MSNRKRHLKICFMGGRQAGVIVALSILAKGYKICSAVSYSAELTSILKAFKIPLLKSTKDKKFIKALKASDLLVSVHGREIVGSDLLRLPKIGAINIHPYLYKYKGSNPVERALRDRNFKASVGAHIMKEKVDAGRVIVEEFVDVSGSTTVAEIYNRLYQYYCKVILKILKIYSRRKI